jgi:L-iditol 2-dehydrogenase
MLVAAMARKLGLARTVIVADIDSGRVDFAVRNRFATHGFTVPRKRGDTVEEKLAIARETAALVGEVRRADGEKAGEVDAVFECTGVESCLQTAIYVRSSFSAFSFFFLKFPFSFSL